jgi:hypothetical protein
MIGGRAALSERAVLHKAIAAARSEYRALPTSIRVKSLFLSGFRLPGSVFFVTMFETVKSEITTAAGKLTHLRRFL